MSIATAKYFEVLHFKICRFYLEYCVHLFIFFLVDHMHVHCVSFFTVMKFWKFGVQVSLGTNPKEKRESVNFYVVICLWMEGQLPAVEGICEYIE